MVAKEFPWAKVVCAEPNRGFACGHNFGLTKTKGEYIALLANDITLSPN